MSTVVTEVGRHEIASHELIKLLVEIVERKILSLLTHNLSTDSLMVKAIQHQLSLGGRRTRSLHALQISQLLGCNDNDSVSLATACELLHQASLVHDDLQDEHVTRRGKSSVWKQFGKDCALCLGDLFLSAAYAALADCGNSTKLKSLLTTTHACVRLVITGQCEDIQSRKKIPTIHEYEEIVRKKSGALLGLPLELAVSYQGAPPAYKSLILFFETYALAYQSIDDMEDYQEDWVKGSALQPPNLLAIMNAKYPNFELANAAAHAFIKNLFLVMQTTCNQLSPSWHLLLQGYSQNLYQRYLPKKNFYE